jgi:hypothetical protein
VAAAAVADTKSIGAGSAPLRKDEGGKRNQKDLPGFILHPSSFLLNLPADLAFFRRVSHTGMGEMGVPVFPGASAAPGPALKG